MIRSLFGLRLRKSRASVEAQAAGTLAAHALTKAKAHQRAAKAAREETDIIAAALKGRKPRPA